MSMPTDNRSLGELVSDALNQLKALLRSEVQLAKAELSDKATKAAVALAMLAAGAAFAIATLVMLLFTVASLLAEADVPDGVAALLATLVGGGATAGLTWAGLQKLRIDTLVPERTVRQLHLDTAAAKGRIP